MDAPALALRFRDPGTVDTIAEHLAILREEGAVWWGWWRKDTEPANDDLLRSLRTPTKLLLVDRSTRRCFLATSLKVRFPGDADVDPARIPAYYRNDKGDVAAWFLLSPAIEPVPYDEAVDKQFAACGDWTLVAPLHVSASAPAKPATASRLALKRRGVLHLSDLHFGADYSFLTTTARPGIGENRRTLTDAVLSDLGRLGMADAIGLILVTGDFTTRGDWSDETRAAILKEFENLRSRLGVEQQQVVAIPGNHDVNRYPDGDPVDPNTFAVSMQKTYKHEREFRLFLEELTGRSWKAPLNYIARFQLPEVDLDLAALNSCAIAATTWTEYGYVGAAGKDVLREMAQTECTRPTYRILALHHHLLPVNQVDAPNSKGVSLTLDAVELLDSATEAAVQLVIHGHQHFARIVRYERVARLGERGGGTVTVVSGGSAGVVEARRGAERNTYSLLEFDQNGVRLKLRELRADGREAASLFDVALPISPIMPHASLP